MNEPMMFNVSHFHTLIACTYLSKSVHHLYFFLVLFYFIYSKMPIYGNHLFSFVSALLFSTLTSLHGAYDSCHLICRQYTNKQMSCIRCLKTRLKLKVEKSKVYTLVYTFFVCYVVLFHSCSSHAREKTLVHEFLISYSHTE